MKQSPATYLRNAQGHKLQDGELFERLSLPRLLGWRGSQASERKGFWGWAFEG